MLRHLSLLGCLIPLVPGCTSSEPADAAATEGQTSSATGSSGTEDAGSTTDGSSTTGRSSSGTSTGSSTTASSESTSTTGPSSGSDTTASTGRSTDSESSTTDESSTTGATTDAHAVSLGGSDSWELLGAFGDGSETTFVGRTSSLGSPVIATLVGDELTVREIDSGAFGSLQEVDVRGTRGCAVGNLQDSSFLVVQWDESNLVATAVSAGSSMSWDPHAVRVGDDDSCLVGAGRGVGGLDGLLVRIGSDGTLDAASTFVASESEDAVIGSSALGVFDDGAEVELVLNAFDLGEPNEVLVLRFAPDSLALDLSSIAVLPSTAGMRAIRQGDATLVLGLSGTNDLEVSRIEDGSVTKWRTDLGIARLSAIALDEDVLLVAGTQNNGDTAYAARLDGSDTFGTARLIGSDVSDLSHRAPAVRTDDGPALAFNSPQGPVLAYLDFEGEPVAACDEEPWGLETAHERFDLAPPTLGTQHAVQVTNLDVSAEVLDVEVNVSSSTIEPATCPAP